MKRKCIIMLAVALFLTGCSSDNEQKVVTSEHTEERNITFEKEEKKEKEEMNPETALRNLEDTLSQFEAVANIEYAGKDRLLVITDQMYLIDIASGAILAQVPDCNEVKGKIKVYGNDENIIIVGKEERESEDTFVFYDENDEEQPRVLALYYDNQLNLLKKINIFEMFALNPFLATDVAVSMDGKLAVYDDNLNGLYLCNPETKEKEEILCGKDEELVYDNKLQFRIGNEIAFGENDDKIIFGAACLNYPVGDGEESIPGYGSVALDGKELYVEKAADEYNIMNAFQEFAMISQDCGFTSPTGKVMKYSFSDNKTEVIQLKSKEESNNLFSSSEGNILAASEENGDKGWNIRFYHTDSGELMGEQAYNALSSESYGHPRIYVFENQNIAVLYFGSLEENGKDVLSIMQF
ncbi:MAG: hypothetical protein NC412_11640 [Roseburia sp.]|nr:hypothetical protein [Roseburia sp.]MCM1279439.1 hypothetical protein [Robinsoniella sp.]